MFIKRERGLVTECSINKKNGFVKFRYRKVLKNALLEIQENRCFWCNKEFEYIKNNDCHSTVEHLTPRSKGGANSQHNIVLSCSNCNKQKGSKGAKETIEWLKTRM